MANHVRGSSSIEGKNAVDRTDERRRGATGTATAFSPITPTVTKSANTMMSQSGPSDYIARSCWSSLQNNPVRRRRDRQTSRLRRPTPLLGWQILKEQAGKNICLQCDETEGGGAEEGRETMLSSFELQIAVCSTSSVCQGGTGIRAGVARAPSSPSTLRRIIKRKVKWRACDFLEGVYCASNLFFRAECNILLSSRFLHRIHGDSHITNHVTMKKVESIHSAGSLVWQKPTECPKGPKRMTWKADVFVFAFCN